MIFNSFLCRIILNLSACLRRFLCVGVFQDVHLLKLPLESEFYFDEKNCCEIIDVLGFFLIYLSNTNESYCIFKYSRDLLLARKE